MIKNILCMIDQHISYKELKRYIELGYKITKCPVCGKYSFNDYYICNNCAWEYDSVLDEDGYSYANYCTIDNYKKGLNK